MTRDNEIGLEMQRATTLIRGQIISIFTNCEAIIDDIIQNVLFDSKEAYNEYMPLLVRGHLTIEQKRGLLKFCLNKHDATKSNSHEALFEALDLLIDKRNKLAHWVLDTSHDGIKLFIQKKQVQLLQRAKDNVSFNKDQISAKSAASLETKAYEVFATLKGIQDVMAY